MYLRPILVDVDDFFSSPPPSPPPPRPPPAREKWWSWCVRASTANLKNIRGLALNICVAISFFDAKFVFDRNRASFGITNAGLPDCRIAGLPAARHRSEVYTWHDEIKFVVWIAKITRQKSMLRRKTQTCGCDEGDEVERSNTQL